MKTNLSKFLVVLTVVSVCSQNVFAGNGNSGGNNSGGSSSSSSSSSNSSNSSSSSSNSHSSQYVSPYTAADLEAFLSTFSSVPAYPADFAWDNVPVPTTSSKPIVPSFPQPPVIPTVTPGSVIDGTMDMASLADLGYEGVRCAAGNYKFPYTVTDTYGVAQNKILEITLPQAPQKGVSDDNGQSEQTRVCKDYIQGVSGKVINGNIVFQCQSGLWRIKQVGCRDTENSCNGGPTVVSVPTPYGAFSSSFGVPVAKYLDGAPGGTFSCKAVMQAPTPGPYPTKYEWAGNINLSCSGGSFSAASNNCTVIDANNNVYPNCAGVIGYYQQTSPGVVTLGRACFPAGTALTAGAIHPIASNYWGTATNQARAIGPQVYKGNAYTNESAVFHWVESNSGTTVQQHLGCGKYTSVTSYTGTYQSSPYPWMSGGGYTSPTSGFGQTSGTTCSIIGLGGCTATPVKTYSIQPVACPQ